MFLANLTIWLDPAMPLESRKEWKDKVEMMGGIARDESILKIPRNELNAIEWFVSDHPLSEDVQWMMVNLDGLAPVRSSFLVAAFKYAALPNMADHLLSWFFIPRVLETCIPEPQHPNDSYRVATLGELVHKLRSAGLDASPADRSTLLERLGVHDAPPPSRPPMPTLGAPPTTAPTADERQAGPVADKLGESFAPHDLLSLFLKSAEKMSTRQSVPPLPVPSNPLSGVPSNASPSHKPSPTPNTPSRHPPQQLAEVSPVKRARRETPSRPAATAAIPPAATSTPGRGAVIFQAPAPSPFT